MGILEVFPIFFLTNTCLQGALPAPLSSPSTDIKNQELWGRQTADSQKPRVYEYGAL